MKLAVIGTGYVGLVTGACFSSLGNQVVCVDKDPKRVALLKKGRVPFYEPGLPELVAKNTKAGRLKFTKKLAGAVSSAEVIFIAVGTPSRSNGQADVSAVIEVAKEISGVMKKLRHGHKVIVNKSTVPVGMGDIVSKILVENKVPKNNFSVVSNPEFLREGSAIGDFMRPDRVVIGADNSQAFNIITDLYRPLNAHIIFTSIKSAELIKYASNAFLATKISFINEIANICERVGSDISEVANAVGLDKRIGRHFLNAGLGYGGSCLPKDVSALVHLSRENGHEPMLLSAVREVNEFQIDAFIGKIIKKLGNLRSKNIAVLGLAFKPETDDMREAPSIKVVQALIKKGARVSAYDPAAAPNASRLIKEAKIVKDMFTAIEGADALVVLTEWPEFVELDLERVKKALKSPLIFDGRNIYDRGRVEDAGLEYVGVGR
ncbi:MAG: UDP-glucose/GDP-mannose dehydrogenase family protein [Candidatus Margulisiibacteriota bacterium]